MENNAPAVTRISPTIYRTYNLHRIHDKLVGDMNLPVEGEALVRKQTSSVGSYAHIKLRISKAAEEFFSFDCIWQVTEEQITSDFRGSVTKTLSFFVAYLMALRGDALELKFEIIDGSFHPVDSLTRDFEMVSLEAIINAFDNSLYPADLSKKYKNA